MSESISAELNITVPFYDLDPMNIVWHGNYIKYMEEARCEFFRKIKYTYEEMYKDGVMYPVAKIQVKYIKSAYFGQQLMVTCTLEETEPAIIFKYKITDKITNEVICTAKTMQMGIDVKTKETIFKLNENFKRKINEYKA